MSEPGKIRIACEGADAVPYKTLIPFQGKLKNLPADNFRKLKAQILETGFSAPIFVWRDGKKRYILDGHQRLKVIAHLVEEEKWECPPLPVVWVEAVTKAEAYRKLLSMASQYGKIDREGLHEFMVEAGMSAEDLDSIDFPNVDPKVFKEEFFDQEPPGPTPEADVDPSSMQFEHTCPKCGYQW